MSNLKELIIKLNALILDCRQLGQDKNEAHWGERFGVLLSWGDAQELLNALNTSLEQATQPERPAPDPTARPFPEPQDFTLVPITEKQAVGMAFDMYDSGYNVRIFRPDGGFDIELNHDKPFKP